MYRVLPYSQYMVMRGIQQCFGALCLCMEPACVNRYGNLEPFVDTYICGVNGVAGATRRLLHPGPGGWARLESCEFYRLDS